MRFALEFFGRMLIIYCLIFLHEQGHRFAIRALGGDILFLNVGVGPPLLTLYVEDELWEFNLFPLWGSVVGGPEQMNDVERALSNPNSAGEEAAGRQLVILFAGPLVNLAIGLLLLSRKRKVGATAESLWRRMTRSVQEYEVVGPLRSIFEQNEKESAPQLWQSLRHFAGQVSLSMGIGNLIPFIPILDGYRIGAFAIAYLGNQELAQRVLLFERQHGSSVILIVVALLLVVDFPWLASRLREQRVGLRFGAE